MPRRPCGAIQSLDIASFNRSWIACMVCSISATAAFVRASNVGSAQEVNIGCPALAQILASGHAATHEGLVGIPPLALAHQRLTCRLDVQTGWLHVPEPAGGRRRLQTRH